MNSLLLLAIVVLPALGAAVNGTAGKALQRRFGGLANGLIACGTIGLSFLITAWLFLTSAVGQAGGKLVADLYPWFQSGLVTVRFELRLDPLSMLMTLVVTGVGSLIHIYSIGYMAHDKSPGRYFSYLNLFTFSMLMLVLSNNLMLMFVGWEGVGLCSYLLIGFWFEDIEKAKAGMKAFIVNRVGDFAFLVGFFALAWGLTGRFGGDSLVQAISVNFDALRERAPALASQSLWGIGLPTLITLLFFIGATGKSAQIPLFVWLPDAMAGPTPVSALIHAATMVTAGVYMIARLDFLYVLSPVTMAVVSGVGALTALFAATIGFAQTDIKKVLAYSTISQLGFMFVGVGVGAFTAGMFHLMTHAFFKACLFLCAGSVIHAMSGEQDIRRMGALRKKLPYTFTTFLVATLAIAGVPGLSGFFSKDEILWRAFTHVNAAVPFWSYVVFPLALTAAFCTAFYMFRLVFMTFFGDETRTDHEVVHHIHESPKTMTLPLVALAALSVVGGFIGLPAITGLPNFLERALEPVFEESAKLLTFRELGHGAEAGIMGLSVLLAGVGIFLAWRIYRGGRFEGAKPLVERIRSLHSLVLNKYYVDEIYQAAIVKPFFGLARSLFRMDVHLVDGAVNLAGAVTRAFARVDGWIDAHFVDGMVNGVAAVVQGLGARLRRVQTGLLQDALYLLISGLLFLVVAVRLLQHFLNGTGG